MAPRQDHKLCYADYERLSEGNGNRYEVLDGDLYVTPAPSPLHQRLSKRLQRMLEAFFEARGLGEVFDAPIDLVLAEHDIVQPDLLVVGDPGQIGDRAIHRAPLLVVEVLSPSTRAQDRGIKAQRYAAVGVPHYWIVDPDWQRVECLRLEGDSYRVVVTVSSPEVLRHPDWPDLVVDLGALWR